MPSHPYRRHDLLRVEPLAWSGVLASSSKLNDLSAEARNLVQGWVRRGWPVIVRRGEGVGDVAVGLPLPPSLGKLRLGFLLPNGSPTVRIAGPSPAEAALSAPEALRPQLDTISALGARLQLQPTVFGALLWQHLTGLTYLRPGSDIDVLWPAPPRPRLGDLLDGLATIDTAGPARLDGEIVLPDGAAVNWRELHGELARPNGTVLVKSMQGADLRCARHLFA